MASACNILQYEGAGNPYLTWLGAGGAPSPNTGPWGIVYVAPGDGAFWTFDDGGFTHWGIAHAGRQFQYIKSTQKSVPGTWAIDPIAWCQAKLANDHPCGLGVWWGSLAIDAVLGRVDLKQGSGYHAITLWKIDEWTNTLTITDSDDGIAGSRDVSYTWAGNDWLILNLYPGVNAHVNYAVSVGLSAGYGWVWPCDFDDLAGGKVTVTFCASPPAPASPEAGNTYWDVIEDMGGRRGRADIITPTGTVVLEGTGDTWLAPWNISNATADAWIEQVWINLATVPCSSRVAFDVWGGIWGTGLSADGNCYDWVAGPQPTATYGTLAPGPSLNAGDMYLDLVLGYACNDLDPAWFPPNVVHEFMADTDDSRDRPAMETRPDCGNSECWGYLADAISGFAASEGDGGVLVQWTYLMLDFDNAGFNIHRSVEESGDYELLNDELLTGGNPFKYVDPDVQAGQTYYYKLGIVDLNGSEELYGPVSAAVSGTAAKYQLLGCYPNPTMGSTTISYQMRVAGQVAITIYDSKGRLVRSLVDREEGPGSHEALWDGLDDSGREVAPGMYYYNLAIGGWQDSQKLVIVR